MRVSIMVAGASGLNWPRWKRLVQAVESFGFDGIYRSDHFLDHWTDTPSDALEACVSLAWAADNSKRIDLGVLVSPLSFRDPRILAWQAAAINDLADGRLRLGLGVGWQPNEHEAFGFEPGSIRERCDRYEEGLQVVRELMRSKEPVTLQGDRFPLQNAMLRLHAPAAIVIGGNGMKRTLPLAARYADEWNCMMLSNDGFRERNTRLNELLDAEGRDRTSVRRSLMCRCVLHTDRSDTSLGPGQDKYDDFIRQGAVAGDPSEIVELLGRKEEAGVESIMLQWMDQDDIAGLETIAKDVLPHVQGKRQESESAL